MEKKRVADELLSSFKDPTVIVMSDWLKVRGTLKSWTKLWCILKPGLLLLYKSPKTKVCIYISLFFLTLFFNLSYCICDIYYRVIIGLERYYSIHVKLQNVRVKKMDFVLNYFIRWSNLYGLLEDQKKKLLVYISIIIYIVHILLLYSNFFCNILIDNIYNLIFKYNNEIYVCISEHDQFLPISLKFCDFLKFL